MPPTDCECAPRPVEPGRPCERLQRDAIGRSLLDLRRSLRARAEAGAARRPGIDGRRDVRKPSGLQPSSTRTTTTRRRATQGTPSQSARFQASGSNTTCEAESNLIVALCVSSYFGQPGFPRVANATQAARITSARPCGGLAPATGSVSHPRVSKTKRSRAHGTHRAARRTASRARRTRTRTRSDRSGVPGSRHHR